MSGQGPGRVLESPRPGPPTKDSNVATGNNAAIMTVMIARDRYRHRYQ
jgi:hypothetical protein